MKNLLITVGILVCAQVAFAQESGKDMFQQRCAACHSIGGGRLAGPDLAGVNERRSEAWLLKFIKTPQTVINAGDSTAKALFDDFKMVMPDQALSDEQIKGILAFIKEKGGGKPAGAPAAATSKATPQMSEPTPEEITRGRDLFQGKIRFTGGGPSCISCHNTTTGIGGGSLAADLSTVFSKMGPSGIEGILKSAPFPVMQTAFADKPLQDDEVHSLIQFLYHADKENTLRQPREYGWVMFGVGLGGVGLLVGLYSFKWRQRKRGSVNQDIYDRQIKSQ